MFVRKGGARFGANDETLSSVFGKNRRLGTCRPCIWMCMLLHKLDRNHCEKTIELDEGDSI